MKFQVGDRVRWRQDGKQGRVESVIEKPIGVLGYCVRVTFPGDDEPIVVAVTNLDRVQITDDKLAAAADVITAWGLWPPDTEDAIECNDDCLPYIVKELQEAIA